MMGMPTTCVCIHSFTLDHKEISRETRLAGDDDVILKCNVPFCTCAFTTTRVAREAWGPPDE